MSRQILAIDIRKDTLAAVLLNAGLKLSTIVNSAVVPLPGQTASENPLLQALEELKAKIDCAAANVVVSLPADGIICRNLNIPFKEDNKIRQVLPFELEPLLPVGVDNLKIDFHKNHIGDQTAVLAVAMEQAVVQNYMDTLSAADIHPQLVVPGGFPLVKYFTSHEELASEQFLVLEVDGEKTTLFAVDAGRIELVRRLSSAAGNDQAAETLALRIRQTITAMGDRQIDVFAPSSVFVTGPGIQNADALERISKALELPTENVKLSRWMPRLDMDPGVDWNPDLMNSALALALLEAEGRTCVNFHRIHSPFRNYWTSYRHYVMGPAALLAIALIIGMSGVMIESYQLSKRVGKLNSQIKQVYQSTFPDSRVKDNFVNSMTSKIKEIKKGNAPTAQGFNQVRSIDVLLQVSQLIPSNIDVLLTRLNMGAGSVTISGETVDFNAVDDIKSRVEKGELFKQVTIASANMDKSGKKVRFKLKIDL